jgi:integrase/recombinase XerD
MTALRRRMLEDLQLRGLAPKPQQCYVAAVQQLARHDGRAPDQLGDAELRHYFLFWLNEKNVAESTFRIHLDGIRCFDERTLKRPWPVFDLVRPRSPPKLPVVLSPREVRSLLALVEHPDARMCLRMIYACGLRLREGTPRQVADLDPQRLLVRVRQGKGGKARLGPLAERTLQLFREYWPLARSRPWLVPARHRPMPLSATSLHQTFNAVVRQRRIPKEASSHTLRHSSATPRVARGVSLRVIQALLGHRRLRTTAPLHASDATDLGRRARHHPCPHGRSLKRWLHGHAGMSGGLSAFWRCRPGPVRGGSAPPPSASDRG